MNKLKLVLRIPVRGQDRYEFQKKVRIAGLIQGIDDYNGHEGLLLAHTGPGRSRNLRPLNKRASESFGRPIYGSAYIELRDAYVHCWQYDGSSSSMTDLKSQITNVIGTAVPWDLCISDSTYWLWFEAGNSDVELALEKSGFLVDAEVAPTNSNASCPRSGNALPKEFAQFFQYGVPQ